MTDQPPIRSGWVKARLRHSTRSFFLTLDSLSLFFRKSQKAAVKKQVLLSHVSSLKLSDACSIDITAKTEEIRLFIDPAEDCLAWAEAIKHAAGSRMENAVVSVPEFREAMSRACQVLYVREASLQSLNEATFLEAKKKVEETAEQLFKVEASLLSLLPRIRVFTPEIFRNITDATTSLSKPLPSSEELEDGSLRVSINPALIRNTIEQVVVVQCANPKQCCVKRSEGTRGLKWKYSGIHYDALSFSVSKGVQLTGVILCTPTHPRRATVIKDLRILNGRESHLPYQYTHKKPVALEYQQYLTTQTVTLCSEVAIDPGQFYTILMCIEGGSTFKCVDCKERVEDDKGVTWTFMSTAFMDPHVSNKSDAMSGPIAGVCYRCRV